MKKIVILFMLVYITIFSLGTIDKELDLKDTTLGDLFAYISSNSNYIVLGDTFATNQKIDCYFKEGTSYKEILNMVERTYNLSKIERGNTIIFKEKKKGTGEILVGKIVDIDTKKGVSGVKIEVKRDDVLETSSGNFGEFIIDNMNTGAYFLSINSENYGFEGDFIEIEKGVNTYNIFVTKKSREKKENIIVENKQKNKKDDIIEHIYLENSNYLEIEKVLKETFDKNLRISISPGSNAVVISGKGEDVYKAEALIRKLDKKQKQVRVMAEILDVKENLFEELGVTWAYDSRKQMLDENKGVSIGTLVDSSLGDLGGILGSSFTFVGKYNNSSDVLKATLNLLETNQDLKTKALPSLILLNGEEGSFKMVEEVIVGEDKQENNGNDTINYEPIFKEAGIILKVTPLIKKDNSIYLTISLEASDFKLKKSLSNQDENSGTFNSEGGSKVSRSLKTRVRLKDNEVILIGGLKRKTEQKIKNKVPILGDIPLVGVFFRSTSSRLENTDLYIKLKAEIIEEI